MATRFPLDPLPGLPGGTLRALLPPELFAVRRFVPERDDDEDGDDEYDAYGDYDPLPEPYDVDPDPLLLAHADANVDELPFEVLDQLLAAGADVARVVAPFVIEAVWRTPSLLDRPHNLHRLNYATHPLDEAQRRAQQARCAAARARFDAVVAARRVAAATAFDDVFFSVDVDGVPLRRFAGRSGLLLGRRAHWHGDRDVVHLSGIDGDHARVYAGDGLVLVDGGSAVGTRVNGGFVDVHRLQPGDVVDIGDHRLRFEVDVRAGTVVGGVYRVVAARGVGVYRGAHVDSDAAAIVKFADGCDDVEGLVARARAAAAIDHRGVVKSFVVGVDDNGVVYVVTRTAGGSVVSHAPRPLTDIHRLGAGVAAALAAAHDVEAVHGRVSGAVIHEDDGLVTVRDFGWWWGRDDDDDGGSGFAFRAPEVIDARPPTPASDVWSFAVLLQRWLGDAAPPPTWAPLLTASLSPDPTQRPAMSAWLRALER